MSYREFGLSFNTLREANIHRLPQFKNKHGGLAHKTVDGSDWSPSQWLQAVIGELGEYANERKKYERGDLTLGEFKEKAAKELADVQTYLDILARRCLDDPEIGYVDNQGIDLGKATIAKFNEVSKRVGSNIIIKDNGSDWEYDRLNPPEGEHLLGSEGTADFDWDNPPGPIQMLLAKENRAITPATVVYATVMPPVDRLRAAEPPADTAELQNLPDAVERVKPGLDPAGKRDPSDVLAPNWRLVPKDNEAYANSDDMVVDTDWNSADAETILSELRAVSRRNNRRNLNPEFKPLQVKPKQRKLKFGVTK